jgi:uncharacterized protein (TIGR02646 family)
MRPVEKGKALLIYPDYNDALDDLKRLIGDYCCYCERQIETHLAVEHVRPKSKNERLRNDWDNFLLSCINCNSCKGKKNVRLDRFVWPHRDNTIRAFVYGPGGQVIPDPALPRREYLRARKTIELVGLDRDPGNISMKKRPASSDKRWMKRLEAWNLAQNDLTRLSRVDTPELRDVIVENALGRGHFSIWMTVFKKDRDMRRRLIAGFRGTAKCCFHPTTTAAVARSGRIL